MRFKDLRGAVPPKRDTFSHANGNRAPDMAEALFWRLLEHLREQHPDFGIGRQYSGVPKRFKRVINAIDSTTIKRFAIPENIIPTV